VLSVLLRLEPFRQRCEAFLSMETLVHVPKVAFGRCDLLWVTLAESDRCIAAVVRAKTGANAHRLILFAENAILKPSLHNYTKQ